MSRSACWLRIVAAFLFAVPAAAAEGPPAVAQLQIRPADPAPRRALVFFIAAAGATGAAAVGAAHSVDLEQLARAERLEFRLGASRQLVSWSRGFLAPPGRPFNAPDSKLRGDFAVYALETPPTGVRVLEPETQDALTPGSRVRLLGPSPGSSREQDTLRGSVIRVTHTAIEVELDLPHELRGWGGAPVLSARTGRVAGILEARWPHGAATRVAVAPIGGVVAALTNPLEGGSGQPFARFAAGGDPPPPAAPDPGAAPARLAGATPARLAGATSPGREDPPPPAAPRLRESTRVHLQVEYPPAGSAVGDSVCGVFVAGRALAHRGSLPRFDVALVVDTSESTREPSDTDIDGDGVLGTAYPGTRESFFGNAITDPGDSILAAEIAAARRLVRGLDPRNTRVSVISFSGKAEGSDAALFARPSARAAILRAPLSSDYRRVERAFREILEEQSGGATDMAAGIDLATRELLAHPGAPSAPGSTTEKIVLFFTDGRPTLPHPGFEADNVRAVLRAAERARAARVRIHSFAIGPAALEGPVAAIEMARRTGGFFTPVRHPGDLRSVVESVSFASLSDIRVRSAATGRRAHPFRTSADGSWSGLVPMPPGRGRVEIVARAADGSEARETLELRVDPSSKAAPVSPELAARRNRLLEDCLRNAKQARRGVEQDHAEKVRKQLQVAIEGERKRARQRAADQGKRLQIEVEDPAPR